MPKKILSILLIVAVMFLSACSFSDFMNTIKEDGGAIKTILTDSYISYSMTKMLIGENANVSQLTLDSLSPKEKREIRKSDLLIIAGEEYNKELNDCLNRDLNDIKSKKIIYTDKISRTEIDFNDNVYLQAVKNNRQTHDASESTERTSTQEIEQKLSLLEKYDEVRVESDIGKFITDTYNKDLSEYNKEITIIINGTRYTFGVNKNIPVFIYLGSDNSVLGATINTRGKVYDKYYWLSFENMKLMLFNIKNKIAEYVPELSAEIEQNYNEIVGKINSANARYKELLRDKIVFLFDDAIPYSLLNEIGAKYASPKIDEFPILDFKTYKEWLILNAKEADVLVLSWQTTNKNFGDIGICKMENMEKPPESEKTFIQYIEENLNILFKCSK